MNIWVEKYRPKKLEDLVLLPKTKVFFENQIKNKTLSNMLFFGSAGLGKTSLAKALGHILQKEILYINASLESNIDTIRTKVAGFAYTDCVFNSNGKLVILDEAERLGTGVSAAQDALKVILEETPNTAFIFITNNIVKVIKPLQSRLQVVDFTVSEENKIELMKLYFERLKYILTQEKVDFDEVPLKFLIKKLFPDFRKIINECQKYYISYGKIDKELIKEIDYNSVFEELIKEIKSKNFDGIIQKIKSIDISMFFSLFYEKLEKFITNESKPEAIIVINQYDFQNSGVVNPIINIVACCWELSAKVKFL